MMAEDGMSVRIPDGNYTPDLHVDIQYDDIRRDGVLGVGSNATVYEAIAPDGTPLALKEPNIDSPLPEEIRARFDREIDVWRQVDDHQNIVTLHGAGNDPRPWLALERIDGGSLRSHDPNPIEALWIGIRLSAALAHAHETGFAHLDITPKNVLLRKTEDGVWPVPVLSDWGVAALFEERTTNLEGLSPQYAAPEQFAPDQFSDADGRTDIYQLGVVLYELLTGDLPVAGSPVTLREAVLNRTPAPATGRNPALPAALDTVLDHALAKEPSNRYQSAAGFAAAIAEVFTAETGHEFVHPWWENDEHDSDPLSTDTKETLRGTHLYDRALTLEEQGFVQLTEAFFARREPAPPLEAWRRGLTLADVEAGRAVTRAPPGSAAPNDDSPAPAAERETMTDTVLEMLQGGSDCVVLGPPGSGKSTICKQVACTWFSQGHGPVFYRESGGEAFDRPDELVRLLARTDGHALVVVEDAIRPEARAAFELLDRVDGMEGISVLMDAREQEWRTSGGETTMLDADPLTAGKKRLAPVFVPQPDQATHERFIRYATTHIDDSLDIDPEEFAAEIRRIQPATRPTEADNPVPGELFYLIHRLTALAHDPLAEEPTTLTEAAKELYHQLADLGERALDIGMGVNILNAAGFDLHPELVYALAPEESAVVDDTIDLLDGRVVFPREADWSDGPVPYPAVHETWSAEYLAICLEIADETAARERFGRVLTRLLAIADRPDRREQVTVLLHGDAPYLDRIADDPGGWADDAVERLFKLGTDRPRLASLFDETTDGMIELPEACSDWMELQTTYWRGRMNSIRGDFDRAEREFQRVYDDATSARAPNEESEPLPIVETAQHRGIRSEEEARTDESTRKRWQALSLAELGVVARERGELAAAAEQFEDALARFREIGDEYGEASVIKYLGNVEAKRGNIATAEKRYEESLAAFREFDDSRRQAMLLANLGGIAYDRGESEAAKRLCRESIDRYREIGDRHGEATTLRNLGMIARQRGELEAARGHLKKSLAIHRDLGDRHGEAAALSSLGAVAQRLGNLSAATDYLEESLTIFREIGARQSEAHCLEYLGVTLRERGELKAAEERLTDCLEICRDINDRHGEATSLLELGRVTYKRDNIECACSCFAKAAEICTTTNYGEAVDALRRTVDIYEQVGDINAAVEWCQRAVDFAEDTDRAELKKEFATRREKLISENEI